MTARFDETGVHLRYPANWRLEREDGAEGWTVAIYSPEGAFLTVTLNTDGPDPEQVAGTALEALREEYSGLEADECVEALAGRPAFGHDVRFFSFDLTNTAWTRAFASIQGTVLVYWQANDLELDRNGPVLKAICASLTVEDDWDEATE